MPVAQLQPKDYVRTIAAETKSSLADSRAYTRWLATHHYENFHVVSALLPRKLHQHFFNIYAFCRWADDLGDEIGDPEESLRLLGWWRGELEQMYLGSASHPVFIALKDTVDRLQIPQQPFAFLIQAFERDQRVTRYRTMADVLDYCVYSANPVGHLLLYLCGYRDRERQQLSDFTCTALQLANHWQDVSVDLDKGRVYLPIDLLESKGYQLEQLERRETTPEFREAMREAVDFADSLFQKGLPLAGMVNRRLAVDLELFSRGGMKILEKIKQQNYDVLTKRPRITKIERAALFVRCLPRLLR